MWKKGIATSYMAIFCCITIGITQTETSILTYKTYLNNVVNYHPIAKQSNLKIELANAEMLAAKGLLDPAIGTNWNQKQFDDKLYFDVLRTAVKVPSILGVDVVAGYENTRGDFINPENKTNKYGLWNVGLEANLIQGFWTNERRTAKNQAEIFQKIATNEQQNLINQLFYNASLAYFEWQQYEAYKQVIQENNRLAKNYLDNTIQSFNNGEKTAIDTLEAFILWQDATTHIQVNETKLIKAKQQLENFLWQEKGTISLSPTVLPDTSSGFVPDNLPSINLDDLVNNHPILSEKRNKQDYYEVEQKLKREKLKPKLKVKFNPLLATTANGALPIYRPSDFKWGIDFSMPLRFRKEKAAIEKGKIKIQEISFDIENKQNELKNKIEASREQQTILNQQLTIQQKNVDSYKRLLEAENEKFQYGESSVFLLNKRQEKYISSKLKLINLKVKLQVAIVTYYFYTNSIQNVVNN